MFQCSHYFSARRFVLFFFSITSINFAKVLVAHDPGDVFLHKIVVSSFKNIYAYCPVFTIQMPRASTIISVGARTLNIADSIIHVALTFSQVLVLKRRPTKVYQENIDQV